MLQQFDGNVIGPKILGNSTGLSGFWVIFSITLFGGMFGILGMIAGVPIFAVIYAGIRAIVNQLLLKKTLSTDTKDYLNVGTIEDGEFIPYRAEGLRSSSSGLQDGERAKPKSMIHHFFRNNSNHTLSEDKEEE